MLQLLLCHKKSFSMLGGELALSAVSKGTHYFAGFHALFQPGCKLNVCFGQYPQVWKVESCVVLASINRSPDWSRRCHEHGSTAPFLCTSCRKAPQWCRGRCKRSSLKIRWCSKASTHVTLLHTGSRNCVHAFLYGRVVQPKHPTLSGHCMFLRHVNKCKQFNRKS